MVNRPNFLKKCEHWRHTTRSPGVLTDIYDGKVWKDFMVVQGRPFLQLPNNLCLQLNVDWFTPYKHLKYSVGVIYLVVENLPRAERYKLNNIIIVGCIPGPKEPSKTINSFLKPLIEELLVAWKGMLIKTTSLFGVVPIRCALTCITCDLPATRKVCGFSSFSAVLGCSKCKKRFPGSVFGKRSDYSGYERDTWQIREHREHIEQVKIVEEATTITDKRKMVKKYGVRYSELLRLPYIDIVQHHVIDPMHNLLLGTAKHQMTVWKDLKMLKEEDFEKIQERVNQMKVPKGIGRIPHKINSAFSSFTADQWKNWTMVYSLYCLKDLLPAQHYSCWVLFVEACQLIVQPAITFAELCKADIKLIEFCRSFQLLYGKEYCTPNMHMQLHIKDSIMNYGPVFAFWCFSFERFNGVLSSFQMNWIAPELQMLKKFLAYQNLIVTEHINIAVPPELREFFQQHLGKHEEAVDSSEGSIEVSEIDSSFFVEYRKNCNCLPGCINATLHRQTKYLTQRRSEKLFNPADVSFLRAVYQHIYPTSQTIANSHVPMRHEAFHHVTILGQQYTSRKMRGKQSAAICAYWPAVCGGLTASCNELRVGIVNYFFKHMIVLQEETTHVFANVSWYRTHPRERHFNNPNIIVISPDFENTGPSSFLPLSRVYSRCAIISDSIKFDFGYDNVIIATILAPV